MSKKDEFYVGYQDKAPESITKFLKPRILILLLLVLVTATFFSVGPNKFKDSTFELGNLKTIEGIFYSSPYPMIRAEESGAIKDIMLVGFGKFGAELESLSPKNGSRMVLEGTRIYYKKKMLFQLQPNLDGKYEIIGDTEFDLQKELLGEVLLEGEIVDPKCFFGVMKPGFGKIHRSCATRCLSGGIPPVFVTTDLDGFQSYYILADSNGDRLDQEKILPWVGKRTKISGQLYQQGEWHLVQIKSEEITPLAGLSLYYE